MKKFEQKPKKKKSHMHEIDRSTNTGVMNNNAY